MDTLNDLSPIEPFGEAQSQAPCAPAANILDRISPLQNIIAIKGAHGAHVVTPTSSQTEDEHAHHIQVDMPGVARDSIQLHAQGNLLMVEATRPASAGLCALTFRATILPSGTADASKVTASFQDGVLKLSVPKAGGAAAPAGGTRISVK